MANAKRYSVMLGVRVPPKVKRIVGQLRQGNEKPAETLRRLLYAGIETTVQQSGRADLAAEWQGAR